MFNLYYHVYKKNDKWTVKGSNSKRAVKTFEDKRSAVNAAISIARNMGSNVVVHNKDMKVSKMYKYGKVKK